VKQTTIKRKKTEGANNEKGKRIALVTTQRRQTNPFTVRSAFGRENFRYACGHYVLCF